MTLLETKRTEAAPPARSPVLKTRRLILRAPRADDAQALAVLLNDRRIAENTARIPHPYTVQDAEAFIAHVASGGETVFAIPPVSRNQMDEAMRRLIDDGGVLRPARVDRDRPPSCGNSLG
jgi:RimJ/RimL family protein N-acetyltransferase